MLSYLRFINILAFIVLRKNSLNLQQYDAFVFNPFRWGVVALLGPQPLQISKIEGWSSETLQKILIVGLF